MTDDDLMRAMSVHAQKDKAAAKSKASAAYEDHKDVIATTAK